MSGTLIHILGGGHWQVPTVRLAKALGYRVLVTDMYAERPAYALADLHAVVDIADREATLAVARHHHIDGILCDTTDVGVPTMAYVAERMGLPGIGVEVAGNFTDKYQMRVVTREAGVPNPRFHLIVDEATLQSAVRDLGFPLVIKPVDNQSSRGVRIVRHASELTAAWRDALAASRSRRVIVEQFLSGTEVTVEALCVDGVVTTIGISDKEHFPHRPEVANRLTYPADVPAITAERIRAVNAAVVRALGLGTGVTHAEYMICADDVYLVEIAARGAGSRVYSTIVPYLAGVPIAELYLKHVMGEPISARPDGGERAANLGFFSFPAGRVTRIEGVEDALRLPGVNEILLEFGVGDVLRPAEDDRSRPGLVVVLGSTRQDVLDTTAAVYDTVKVETDDC